MSTAEDLRNRDDGEHVGGAIAFSVANTILPAVSELAVSVLRR